MKLKRVIVMFLLVSVFALNIAAAQAIPPYKSYTYSFSGGFALDAASPAPYLPLKTIDKRIMGVEFKQPEDMCYDKDRNMYIADAGDSSIIVLDKDFKFIRKIDKFINAGKEDKFRRPEGVFVTEKGDIYITDTENGRVVSLDKDGNLIKVFGKPQDETFNNKTEYKPKKITVDKAGNMFIIGRGDNYGLIQLDSEGTFTGYVGSNQTVKNPALLMLKRFMTQKQKQSLLGLVPVEYTNISMDDQGFIYAVTQSEAVPTPVRRLNPSGSDVLLRKGWTQVDGDIKFYADTGEAKVGTIRSQFVDIVSEPNGIYNVLDGYRCRVFTYNMNGDLLYVFGVKGAQFGTLNNVSAIEKDGDNLLVLDRTTKTITIFAMTDYARLIQQATVAYQKGYYDESVDTWQKVLRLNANFDLAYLQSAHVMLRKENYAKSMEYYRLCNFRGSKDYGYSKAFKEYKKIYLREHFNQIGTTVLVLVALYIIYRIVKRKKKKTSSPDFTMEGAGE